MKMRSLILPLLPISIICAEAPNYEDHVLPILKKHCNGCHNADKRKQGSIFPVTQLPSWEARVAK